MNQQIFLCHASEDKESVRAFYDRLKAEGFDPWLDEENLLPGQNWEEEIPQALRSSAAVVVFLSKTSVSKKSYVQREFKLAYDALQEIPEGQVFVIPVKLDDCAVPRSFSKLQWTSMKSTSGTDKVIQSLRAQIPPDNSTEAEAKIRRTIKGAAQRRAKQIDEMKKQAIAGKSPSERRDAIRTIARQIGSDASEWMAEVAWRSKYSAARTEAIDQVAALLGAAAVEWLKEAAEAHTDKACRTRAAEKVISIQGIESFGWAGNIFQFDSDYGLQYGMSKQIYLVSKDSRDTDSNRQTAAKILRRMFEHSLRSDFAERLLASFVMLSNGSADDRRFAFSFASDRNHPHEEIRALAIILRTWPTHRDAKRALKRYAESKTESRARKAAQDYLEDLGKKEGWRLEYKLRLQG